MKRLLLSGLPAVLVVVVLAISMPLLGAQAPLRLQPGDTVIRGGTWIDVERGTAVRNTGIVVRDGVIMAMDADLASADLSQAHVIDLASDEYILPGLFDLHAHYTVDLFGDGRVDEATVNPVLFLANGVTSTFPAGEIDPSLMIAARERIDRGEQIGPRIYDSGPYFGTARPGWENAVETPARIREEVDYWAAHGVRAFKAKGIRPEQLRALIDEAHKYGLTVTGHLDSGFRDSVNPRDAILMGIDRIEHFIGGDAFPADRSAYASLEFLDASRPEVTAEIGLFLRQHVFFDPTLTAYGYFGRKDPTVYTYWIHEMQFLTPYARHVVESHLPRKVNEQFERIYYVKRKVLKAFYDAGGRDWITLGTDHPSWGEFFSGFGSHRELHAFVLSGIPPADALRFATINGARALNVATKLGSLDVGKYADLFVVRGNPLEAITNTHRVQLVMKSGQLYDPKKLLASVVGKLGPKGPEDADRWKGKLNVKAPTAGGRGRW
jgi:imidazolonepropionase-like amidohydrolase